MTEQHTPGPWTLQAGRSFKTASGEFYLSYGSDRYGNPNFRNFCELDANARLIAAAPETAAERDRLKADKAELVEWLDACLGMVRGESPPNWDGIRAAIAKAKGE